MKKVSFKGLLLVSSILIFTSCEIGLGGAVDTEPPSVKIVAPEADARVRETFTMSGNWNDDMSIGSIDVSFRDVNDPSKIYKDFKFRTELTLQLLMPTIIPTITLLQLQLLA